MMIFLLFPLISSTSLAVVNTTVLLPTDPFPGTVLLHTEPLLTLNNHDGPVAYWHYLFYMSLLLLMFITSVLAWFAHPRLGPSEVLPSNFANHKWKYLVVWVPAIAADWLQGPYVYHLYEAYGYKDKDIAELFVCGFGASMIFGVIAGAAADVWGRKFCAHLYCVLYFVSCMTKHFNMYWILMFGRLTGGIATSLLFSTFECWMVAEHKQRHGFSDALLRYMFGLMFFFSYLTAIVCGFLSQFLVNSVPFVPEPGHHIFHYGGDTIAFDLAAVCLLCAMSLIRWLWDENYGEDGDQSLQAFGESFSRAGVALLSSWRVALVGCVVFTFEGAMYAFIFKWTPAIESAGVIPPHGHVFSALMMACMCGASVFSLTDPAFAPSKTLFSVCVLAVMAFIFATSCVGHGLNMLWGIVAGFIMFEFSVGVYFPAVGTLKSQIVPEKVRAGVYNIYRVPLNCVVCCVLLVHMSLRACLTVVCGLLAAASIFASVLIASSSVKPLATQPANGARRTLDTRLPRVDHDPPATPGQSNEMPGGSQLSKPGPPTAKYGSTEAARW